jgi:dipeptidyl aminopeptidase/acylaminoacyl peptidase
MRVRKSDAWVGRLVVVTVAVVAAGCARPSPVATTARAASPWHVAWLAPSRDGGRVLIFERAAPSPGDAEPARVSVADLGTHSLTPVHVDGPAQEGRWSPDGRLFAGAAKRGRLEAQTQVGILDPVSGAWQWVAPPRSSHALWSGFPAWSPDGQRLASDGHLGAGPFVVLHDLRLGTSKVVAPGESYRVSNPLGRPGYVILSREDSAFADPWGGSRTRSLFYQVPLRPGREQEVLPDHIIERLSVSPSGDAAAALCFPDAGTGAPADTYEVWVVPLTGGRAARRLSARTFNAPTLVWSDDGHSLVVSRQESGNTGSGGTPTPPLALLDTGTGTEVPLVDRSGLPIRGGQPQWTNHDRAILYLSSAGGAIELWRYDMGTRRTTRLWP